jgi:hypothetical protein
LGAQESALALGIFSEDFSDDETYSSYQPMPRVALSKLGSRWNQQRVVSSLVVELPK